jgi:hypothetical protein
MRADRNAWLVCVHVLGQICNATVYHAQLKTPTMQDLKLRSAVHRGSLHILYITKINVGLCYKQHDCTAVQLVLAYLPHRPAVFSATTIAVHNRFSSHRRQRTEPPPYGKYCQLLSAFVSFVLGTCKLQQPCTGYGRAARAHRARYASDICK